MNVFAIALALWLAGPEPGPTPAPPAEPAPGAAGPREWDRAPPGAPEDVALWNALRDAQNASVVHMARIVQASYRLRYGRYYESLDEKARSGTAAEAEGARRLTGGQPLLQDTGGFYMAPTVFDAVRPDMRIAREEVFGPVLAVTAFDDEDEAIRLANATVYGLASAVWTANLARAHRLVRAVRAGVVHVNTYGGSDLTVPLGGVRQSGNGYDKSLHALAKYTDLKTAWIALG